MEKTKEIMSVSLMKTVKRENIASSPPLNTSVSPVKPSIHIAHGMLNAVETSSVFGASAGKPLQEEKMAPFVRTNMTATQERAVLFRKNYCFPCALHYLKKANLAMILQTDFST